MKDDYDDSKPNPFRKEWSTSSSSEEVWLDENVANFILNLPREITAFTGKHIEKNIGKGIEYRLETNIYKDTNYGEKYNSKKIFLKNNILFEDFLNNIKKYFWNKGWVHGDLNPSNYVIYYSNQKPKLKIFDFEHTEKYTLKDLNTVGYFKFLWKEELRLLYYIYANGMELNKDNFTWNINGIEMEDKMSKTIYMFLNSENNEKININKLLNYIIYHLKCFVYSENILSKKHWEKEHRKCKNMGYCIVGERELTTKERYDSMRIENKDELTKN